MARRGRAGVVVVACLCLCLCGVQGAEGDGAGDEAEAALPFNILHVSLGNGGGGGGGGGDHAEPAQEPAVRAAGRGAGEAQTLAALDHCQRAFVEIFELCDSLYNNLTASEDKQLLRDKASNFTRCLMTASVTLARCAVVSQGPQQQQRHTGPGPEPGLGSGTEVLGPVLDHIRAKAEEEDSIATVQHLPSFTVGRGVPDKLAMVMDEVHERRRQQAMQFARSLRQQKAEATALAVQLAYKRALTRVQAEHVYDAISESKVDARTRNWHFLAASHEEDEVLLPHSDHRGPGHWGTTPTKGRAHTASGGGGKGRGGAPAKDKGQPPPPREQRRPPSLADEAAGTTMVILATSVFWVVGGLVLYTLAPRRAAASGLLAPKPPAAGPDAERKGAASGLRLQNERLLQQLEAAKAKLQAGLAAREGQAEDLRVCKSQLDQRSRTLQELRAKLNVEEELRRQHADLQDAIAAQVDSTEALPTARSTGLEVDVAGLEERCRALQQALSTARELLVKARVHARLQVETTRLQSIASERLVCKVCLDEPVNCALLPCGHLSLCSTCTASVDRCPVCRQSLTGSQPVFFT